MSYLRSLQIPEFYHIIYPSCLGSGVVSYYISVLSRFRSSITSYIRPVQGSGLVSHRISVLSRFRFSIILYFCPVQVPDQYHTQMDTAPGSELTQGSSLLQPSNRFVCINLFKTGSQEKSFCGKSSNFQKFEEKIFISNKELGFM